MGVSDGSLDMVDGIELSTLSRPEEEMLLSGPSTHATSELPPTTHAAPFASARCPVPGKINAQQSAGDKACNGEPSYYDALDDGYFRLVRITLDPSSGCIECRTQHFPLDDPPRYTAVSYACGPGPATFDLKLNARDWHIRKNLSHFLRQRVQMSPASEEWLWIDAICINQENISERSHQVKLMADIYGKASRALIWLGLAYEDSDAAMGGLSHSTADEWWPLEALPWIWALGGLCSRDYWKRLWCLQEMKLAKSKDIMCGSEVIPWAQFETFVARLGRYNPDQLAPSGRALYIYNSAATRMIKLMPFPLSTSLWKLLDMTTHLRCEVKKDKAYALFGLTTREAAIIQPYYNQDMPAFLNSILKYHIEHDLTPAEITLTLVADCCEKLETLFGAKPGTVFESSDSTGHPSALGLVYRRLSTHSTVLPGMSLLWAIRYDHHPRVQEQTKLVYRRHHPSSYVLSGLCLVGCVAAIPLLLRKKDSLLGIIMLVFVITLMFFFLFRFGASMIELHTMRTGRWKNYFIEDSNPYTVSSHRWRPSWKTLTFVPFVLGELLVHYTTSAFQRPQPPIVSSQLSLERGEGRHGCIEERSRS
jgi:hypothetical protein